MNINNINRRDFLRLMGWSATAAGLAACDIPTTTTLEEGKETVVGYLSPVEYAVPGVGVWYASACTQCSSGCGIHGKVREGRALKLEGNPDSPLNAGKLCQMGQAGVQGHYNPDRLTSPLVRRDGKLVGITWEEAYKLLEQKAGPAANLAGDRFAWVTGAVSGHQAVLLTAHLEAMQSQNHFVHEVLAPSVGRAVYNDMLGDPSPRYHIDKARLILSFGADFLGAWDVSPVHFSTEYAKFRTAPRGILVQIEPKMTLTGGNADLWVPIRPGTEGVLALGLVNLLTTNGAGVPLPYRAALTGYDLAKTVDVTGIPAEQIQRIVALLKANSPSLVLSGAPVEGQAHGYEATTAVQLLNLVLGNFGKTITPAADFPFPQLTAKSGNRHDLLAFGKAAQSKQFDVVFFHGTNPVYSAPGYLKLEEQLQNIPFKVAFAQFPDETALAADLVLPISSFLEDWGTHVPAYQSTPAVITVQQPLMERLYGGTVGFGNLMLTLLKAHDPKGYAWNDYYTYLQSALAAMPASYKAGTVNAEEFWDNTLQSGLIKINAPLKPFKISFAPITLPEQPAADSSYPLHLVPIAQLGLWDGRHANLPWLQEAPDQISKVVWDTWAEMHPATAGKLGITEGDVVEITSAQGSIKVKAIVFKGVHPDVVAVSLGQGHTEYGRYAKDQGANLLKILDPVVDSKTGDLALYGTRVKVANLGKQDKLVIEGRGNASQDGRKLVRTIPAEQLRKTEGA